MRALLFARAAAAIEEARELTAESAEWQREVNARIRHYNLRDSHLLSAQPQTFSLHRIFPNYAAWTFHLVAHKA
ncbi:hypothetical protein SAMN05216337_1006161 [Bradyrhizobium brasilense]|uniref:Uncharacterized protein n=1 Tax=Bradyrhizobium brasilense TaxID=1419277 RepID=A0A1G6QYW1_9BRAD|nr:hypothetical protein SAMN05216337_1006161 [Bradyrhizobium brasilense]